MNISVDLKSISCETQCDKVCAQEENSFNWWQILTSAGNYLQIERITKKNTKITLKRITKHTFVLKSSIHWESYPELSTKDETEIWKIIHNALHCNGDCLTNLKIALHSCNVFFSSHGFGVFNVLMSFPLCSFVTWHMKLFLNEASLGKNWWMKHEGDEYEVCLDCKNVEQAIGDQVYLW